MTLHDQTKGYAGDLSVTEAWDLLAQDPKAQLVDVRTTAEWSFVGLPDLSGLKRTLHCIEWQQFPGGMANLGFVQEAAAQLSADKDTPILFLCRSGGRSRAAAMAMAAAGYSKAFNIAGGFEGDLDAQGHRGKTNGWKAAGLPWRQS